MNKPLSSQHSTRPAKVSAYARYHSDAAVSQYCDAHYGPDKFNVANFPKRIVQLCLSALQETPRQRALDLGCCVGRTSFELATHFEEVTAIDFSSRFIEIALRMQKHGKLCYQLAEEGTLLSDHEVTLAQYHLEKTAANVTFSQGDVYSLKTPLNGYNLILAANLIDRLPDPRMFLSNIHHKLTSGRLLVLASPNNWLEHYTHKKHWLGGYYFAGSPQTTLKSLKKKLSKNFVMVKQPEDIEFVLRESSRTFRHNLSQVTFWRKI